MTTLEQTYLEGLKNYSSSNNLTFQNPVTGAQYTAAEYGHYFGGVEPYLYHDCMLAGLKLLEGNNDFKIHITARDIANLKKEWLSDPIWDIEDTEGFEEVRDELKAFAAEQLQFGSMNLTKMLGSAAMKKWLSKQSKMTMLFSWD